MLKEAWQHPLIEEYEGLLGRAKGLKQIINGYKVIVIYYEKSE